MHLQGLTDVPLDRSLPQHTGDTTCISHFLGGRPTWTTRAPAFALSPGSAGLSPAQSHHVLSILGPRPIVKGPVRRYLTPSPKCPSRPSGSPGSPADPSDPWAASPCPTPA